MQPAVGILKTQAGLKEDQVSQWVATTVKARLSQRLSAWDQGFL